MTPSESLVEAIFIKCGLVYGRDFLGRWEGLDLSEVKADWARELAGFLGSPGAILYGLNNLPTDKAPTVLQFRAICNRYEPPKALALREPPADPARVAAVLAKMRQATRLQ